MVQLEEFVDGISIHLGNADASGVPRIAIIFAARQAVKRFCDESLSYIASAYEMADIDNDRQPLLSDIEMIRVDRRCELTLPMDTHIIKVWSLSSNACERQQSWDYIYDYPNFINLPSDNYRGDQIVVSLSINQSATEIPDYIFNQYYDGVLSGTIAYLQSMPNREWALPNFAENHEAKFVRAIEKARHSVNNGFRKQTPASTIPGNFG